MHIIAKPRLKEFAASHPDSEKPLLAWHREASHASWKNFAEIRAMYGSADQYKQFTIFNIGGNKYRLVVRINFASQTIFVRHILTHEAYDRGRWKDGG